MASLPRGTVTLLFTDIEGSTQLLHALGGERYAAVLAAHQRVLREAFAAHAGREVDTQGDAFFVAFPRAVDAVQAAVAAQRALVAHGLSDAEVAERLYLSLHTVKTHLRSIYGKLDVPSRTAAARFATDHDLA